jgi:hypothetical protein
MIEQYLSNNNKNATVSFCQKFWQPNGAYVLRTPVFLHFEHTCMHACPSFPDPLQSRATINIANVGKQIRTAWRRQETIQQILLRRIN